MKNVFVFNKIVFFMTLLACTFMGALTYQNIVEHNYDWIIGDFIILVLLYINAYFYGKDYK